MTYTGHVYRSLFKSIVNTGANQVNTNKSPTRKLVQNMIVCMFHITIKRN